MGEERDEKLMHRRQHLTKLPKTSSINNNDKNPD